MPDTCRILLVSLASVVAFADRTAFAADAPADMPAAAPVDPLLRVDSGGAPASLYRVDPDVWIVTGGGGRHGSGPSRIEHWTHVCDAPCDVPVRREGIFRVAGDGVSPSPTFTLGKDVSAVRVQPGSAALRTTGAVGTVVGGAFVLTGLALMAVPRPETLAPPPGFPPPPPGPSQPDFAAIGLGAALVGTVLLGAGVAMVLANGTTVDAPAAPGG